MMQQMIETTQEVFANKVQLLINSDIMSSFFLPPANEV